MDSCADSQRASSHCGGMHLTERQATCLSLCTSLNTVVLTGVHVPTFLN